ncbi:hypothetical protein PEC18_05460 [Paucibacter sp. O1-1]|nr:hypothetical protein [Paucibacter sp. O1-1]MDA3825317.1 hypothetical protein [Paucibacter sp. O1-1]
MLDRACARELIGPSLAIANHNAPEQVVVSGPLDAIAALETQGMAARRLPVAAAFHSAQVAPACAPFGAFLAAIDFAAPRVLPVYANAHAAPYAGDVGAVLAQQIAQPVRFVADDRRDVRRGRAPLRRSRPRHGAQGPRRRDPRRSARIASIALDRQPIDPGKNDLEPLLAGLAQLVAAGHLTRVSALFADVRVPAPPAPSTSTASRSAAPTSASPIRRPIRRSCRRRIRRAQIRHRRIQRRRIRRARNPHPSSRYAP